LREANERRELPKGVLKRPKFSVDTTPLDFLATSPYKRRVGVAVALARQDARQNREKYP